MSDNIFTSNVEMESTATVTGVLTASAAANVIRIGTASDLTTPPAIGAVTPAAGKFTTLEATGVLTASDAANVVTLGTSCTASSPPAIGAVAPAAGKFTTLEATGTARYTTALGKRCFHISVQTMNPSGSGATWVEPDANTVGGWLLPSDSVGDSLTFNARVGADWDGATNPTVDVYFAIPEEESDEDDVVLRLTSYYNTVGDTASKIQGTGAEGVVSTNTDGIQYQVYKATFTIDWDFTDNILEVGDNWTGILNWEDSSTVLAIIVVGAIFSYATTHIGIESGDV